VLTLFASATSAQNVTGEWYGVGKVKKPGEHNSYLSEMVLKQKGTKVTGELNYFYRSAEIKTKVSGRYDARFKVLELDPKPMLNFMAKNENGADCPMEGSFTLKTIKGQKILVGQFNPTYEYRRTCAAIDVRFTKSRPAPDSVVDETYDEEVVSTPATKKPVTANADTTKKALVTSKTATASKTEPAPKPAIITKTDSAKQQIVAVKPAIVNKLSQDQQIALALKQRAFETSAIIEVDADSLKVSLYDNGEVDSDSISLFYNRKLVASNQLLSDKPLTFTLVLDNNVNEIAMFAENLGKIPPNTALAIIYAGEQRFELNLTSTLDKNAAIRFKRKVKRIDPKNIN
jgi:hypothetical protein